MLAQINQQRKGTPEILIITYLKIIQPVKVTLMNLRASDIKQACCLAEEV